MAISSIMVYWLDGLAEKGFFRPGENLLEFGPQSISAPDQLIKKIANNRLHSKAPEAIKFFFKCHPMHRQKVLYAFLGFKQYHSIDLFDKSADFKYDLNYSYDPMSECNYHLNYVRAPFEKYFAITSFGTSEHCFNVSASFKSAHNFVKVGGIMLFVLPAFGHITHGFFNIHPNLYISLSKYNNYEIVDFRYVDNFGLRSKYMDGNVKINFDFDNLPITLKDFEDDNDDINIRISELFMKNYLASGGNHYVYDYCFVALRKQTDQQFIYPQQYA